MLKRFFNKTGSGVKTLFNKGSGDAKQLFSKATKVVNQVNNGIDTGLNKAGQISRQVGNYANKAGNIVSGLSPLLAPILGPEVLAVSPMLQGIGNTSKTAGDYVKQGQQMKHNLIQATKPSQMMSEAPSVNFA